MRKFVLLAACVGVFLALPSIAAASAGTLTGIGSIGGSTPFDFNVTAVDGGTGTYFGLENDRSGNCDGDSGSVLINGAVSFNIVCAHFVASSRCCNAGSKKMRFAWGSPGAYKVVRITDNGLNPNAPTDTFADGTVSTLADAIAWVNTGAIGSHNAGGWTFRPVLAGSDYAVN